MKLLLYCTWCSLPLVCDKQLVRYMFSILLVYTCHVDINCCDRITVGGMSSIHRTCSCCKQAGSECEKYSSVIVACNEFFWKFTLINFIVENCWVIKFASFRCAVVCILSQLYLQSYESNGSHVLEISNSSKDDSGRYTVKAHNSKGNSHCSADVSLYMYQCTY